MAVPLPFNPVPKGKYVLQSVARRRKDAHFLDAAWRKHGRGEKPHEWGICARCQKEVHRRGGDGQIDHIRPRSTHPELRYDLTNVRIVCHVCNMYLKRHPLERDL